MVRGHDRTLRLSNGSHRSHHPIHAQAPRSCPQLVLAASGNRYELPRLGRVCERGRRGLEAAEIAAIGGRSESARDVAQPKRSTNSSSRAEVWWPTEQVYARLYDSWRQNMQARPEEDDWPGAHPSQISCAGLIYPNTAGEPTWRQRHSRQILWLMLASRSWLKSTVAPSIVNLLCCLHSTVAAARESPAWLPGSNEVSLP